MAEGWGPRGSGGRGLNGKVVEPCGDVEGDESSRKQFLRFFIFHEKCVSFVFV